MPAESRFLKRRLLAETLKLREKCGLLSQRQNGVSWLVIATLPNAGSTALAQLLLTGKATTTIQPNGEGQWQTFDMHQRSKRWDPDAQIDYDAMRVLWLERVKNHAVRPTLVIEKSPSNLVRMDQILDALAPIPVRLIRLVRDPYAVCASWASRYGPARIASEWGEATGDMTADSDKFFEALGAIYTQRFARFVALTPRSSHDLRYEDLTRDPVSALAPLKSAEPLLADIDASAKLRVKDYEPRPLENMNDRQIAKLTASQIAAISAGLEPLAADLHAFGYELR